MDTMDERQPALPQSTARFPQWLRWPWAAPLLLFGLALLLRTWTLGWGLPYVEHPDEPALVRIAMRMVQNGDPHPYTFHYPSFYFYLLAGATWLHTTWGLHSGLYTSLADLPRDTFFFTSAPGVYIWGRAVAALLGAAIVPLLYMLGQRMYDWRVGLLAALALALSSYHVEHSQYITTDAATGLWVVLALLGVWRIAQSGDGRAYLLAGAAVGLATSTKYNALAVAAAVPLAHALWWGRASMRGRGLGWLLASGGAALLAFVLTTPYILLDWPFFIDSFVNKVVDYSPAEGAGAVGGFFPVDKYARFFWREGLLPTGCLLLLAGLPLLLWRSARPTALLLAASLAELLLLLSFTVHFTRNVLPIFPLLVLLAAASTVALGDLFRKPLARRGMLAVLALILVTPQADDTAWLLRYWSRPHTLAAAAEEINSLPRGMLIAVDMNPVQWAGDPFVTPMERVCAHDAAWYRAHGFRYVLLNEDRRNRACTPTYRELLEAGAVLADYPPRSLGHQPGPGATLVDLGPDPEVIPFVRRAASFGGQVALQGYELQPGPLRARITALEGANVTQVPPGEPLQLNLYLQAEQAMQADYSLFLHLLDADGERAAQLDLLLRADYPTSRWQEGELVLARADMPLPALPPGTYRLVFGLYDAASGARLPVSGADDPVSLTTLTVRE